MCSLVAYDKLQENKTDYEISIGNRVIPNDATVKALKSLGATFNFIGTWLHNFHVKYFDRSESYILAMKEMFKRIPQKCFKATNFKRKKSKIDYRYWGRLVFEKYIKGTTTIEGNKNK